jgi:hypothetical protein
MGHLISAETITLLEGFEEEAEGLAYMEAAKAAAGLAAQQTSLPLTTSAAAGLMASEQGSHPGADSQGVCNRSNSSDEVPGCADNQQSGLGHPDSANAQSPGGDVVSDDTMQWKIDSPATGTAALLDAQQARSARQMQVGCLKTYYRCPLFSFRFKSESDGARFSSPQYLPQNNCSRSMHDYRWAT